MRDLKPSAAAPVYNSFKALGFGVFFEPCDHAVFFELIMVIYEFVQHLGKLGGVFNRNAIRQFHTVCQDTLSFCFGNSAGIFVVHDFCETR